MSEPVLYQTRNLSFFFKVLLAEKVTVFIAVSVAEIFQQECRMDRNVPHYPKLPCYPVESLLDHLDGWVRFMKPLQQTFQQLWFITTWFSCCNPHFYKWLATQCPDLCTLVATVMSLGTSGSQGWCAAWNWKSHFFIWVHSVWLKSVSYFKSYLSTICIFLPLNICCYIYFYTFI